MRIFINHIFAEFLKIKATPVYYIITGCALLIAIFLFISNSLDVNDLSRIGKNPWDNYLQKGVIIISIFMIIPFLVLLVSSFIYTERKSDAHKLLYTLPTSRGFIYFSKIVVIVFLVLLECVFIFILLILSGHILGFFYPEFELHYYTPDFVALATKLTHMFISILGIIGIQFLLNIYSKNILVPIGIGFLGLIIGFILFATNNEIGLYFPYSYAMVSQNLGLIDFDYRTIVVAKWLTNIEVYSILVFLVSVTLGYFYESKRNVK